jgi:hypothetical protein
MATPPDSLPRDRANDKYWFSRLRPIYSAATTAALLRITEEDLAVLVERRDVLALTAPDGEVRFPGFQFDSHGVPLPHLREAIERLEIALHRIDIDEADPWFVALQLVTKTDVWGGRSAAELLRTDQAEEVLWQLAWERIPLTQRAENAKNLAIAKSIAEHFAALLTDVPVEFHLETLYVTTGLPMPLAVILVSSNDGLQVFRYTIDGDPTLTAKRIAADFRETLQPASSSDGGA